MGIGDLSDAPHGTHLACPGSHGRGINGGLGASVRGASAPLTLSREYPGRMLELIGDSARGDDWALVRLRVDGDRIVDADARWCSPQDLRGLTLLEAAAVGGETLPVDALANALGPAVRAAADPRRVAVAMSGGVDSAVTLLKAGRARRRRHPPAVARSERPRRRAGVLLAERGDRRSRDLPPARLAARDARPARAVPARRRDAICARLRARRDAESVHPAATAASASPSCSRSRQRVGAARLATGHYARIVEHHGQLLLARGDRRDEGPELHARATRPAPPRRDLVPAGRADEGSRRAPRPPRQASRPHTAPRARRRASSRATTTARSSGGTGCRRSAGAIVDEAGATVGTHDGFWQFTPGQRRGLGVSAAEPLYALGTDARTNTVVVGPRASLARTRVSARGRLFAPAGRVTAKLRYRSPAVPASVEATASGFRLRLDEPSFGVARGQAAVLYDGDVVVGSGLVTSAAAD